MRFILIISFICCFQHFYSQHKDTLNIITWNIYMRPRQIFHNDQLERANEIVKAVLSDSIDVIVFQEIFDRKARKIITKGISTKYKYSIGPGKGAFLKLNSGVMIFSKYPIEEKSIVYYNECENSDCLAKKAAVFASIKLNENKKINIVGTHLQAIKGNIYTKIRSKQIDIINTLVTRIKEKQLPIIFTGDFNISKGDQLFQKLINTFKSDEHTLTSDRKYSADKDNEYRIDEKNKDGELIDHIFLNKNGNQVSLEKYEVVKKTYLKKKHHNDLSDHYLVRARIIL